MTPNALTSSDAQSANDDCWNAPDFFSNIHHYYHRLRDEQPVYYSETLKSWFVTSYAEIDAIHRDPRFSSVGRVVALLDRLPPETRERLTLLYKHYSPTGGNLIHLDRPEHTRIRRIFARPFIKGQLEPMRPRIQAIVDGLLDRLDGRTEIDLIEDFAFPLPIAVICDLLGIEIGVDRDRFIEWCHDISDIVGANHTTETALSKQNSLANLRAYIESLVADRKVQPRGDFYTMLLDEQPDGDRLTDEEIIASSVTLINGSHETTTNLIGNSILSLQRYPEQEEKLRRDPQAQIESAVEEFLRFESPLNHSTRVTLEDVEMAGQTIPGGQVVGMSLVAANRDPAQFSEPDVLDIERRENRHIAFGVGPHFCLGAPLARMEAQIALASLMERFSSFRLLEEPPWRQNRVQHGLTELKLAVEA